MSLSITQDSTLEAVRSFLLAQLPDGIEVFEYSGNRVPEPKGLSFVVMTPKSRLRLRTNIDLEADVVFQGYTSNTILTVVSITRGVVAIGSQLFGVGVILGTKITGFISGVNGGIGVYSISPSQSVAQTTLSSGQKQMEQGTKLTLQLDVHGPDSADNAQLLSTVFRDSYAVEAFAALGGIVSPLYADAPFQVPFVNDQKQYEFRWVVIVFLQVNPIVAVPQQYMDSVAVDLVNVDAAYPP